jgi:hypothetical protein
VSPGTSSDSRDLAMTPIANGSGGSGALRCDALVFFGASGDLAYKQIFPALAALVKRGVLGVPIIGVARAGWTEEQFVERARRSLEDHRMLDEASLARRDPWCGPRDTRVPARDDPGATHVRKRDLHATRRNHERNLE